MRMTRNWWSTRSLRPTGWARSSRIYSWSPGSTPTKPTWPQNPLISSRSFRRRQSASGCGRLPKRTGQILAVLLENAVRFAPPGGSIAVSGRLQDRWVEASVRDTGPGISPEHLPRLFDRFYRAEASRTRGKGAGTGLGLAIARELARAQGGDLVAENAKEGGATFRLRLPHE